MARTGTTDGVTAATGRSREEWFALLDDWGAVGRPYREVADWLGQDQGLGAWWAQKLVVEYQQARGVRRPGVRPDGTFTVTVSRTIDLAPARVFDTLADPEFRAGWLPDLALVERTARRDRSLRFDAADGTRVNVAFAATAAGRCQVAVEHARLADPAAAAAAKAAWRERLATLEDHLQS